MTTTNNKQTETVATRTSSTEPIKVQIRTFGEFMNRRKVTFNLPAKFTFGDDISSRIYHETWGKFKSLPNGNPFYDAVQQLKAQGTIKLREMMLTSIKGETFVSIVGESTASVRTIMELMNSFFSNCSFDVK